MKHSRNLILIIAATLATPAMAASSWQSQPAWASGADGGGAGSTSRKSYAKESRYDEIAPFTPGSNNLALDVGQVFLMGDLASNYDDSIGTQIHYTYGVSDLFGFDTSLGYSEHSNGRMSMGTLLTGLRTNLAWYDKVVPYLVFGLGFYKPSFEVANRPGVPGTTTLSPLLFGVHMGPGVDLELTKQLFFGAALTFHDVFGATRVAANDQSIEVGGTFTSFLLHAGVTF